MAPVWKPDPVFFATPAELRAWLEANHESASELWVGFWKKATGKPSVTWQQVVDEALCFGWIDGIRKSLDEESYTNRLTPRKARSNWSRINLKRVEELIAAGRMRPAGLRVYEERVKGEEGTYSYEQRDNPTLDDESLQLFRADAEAWEYFQSRPPGYRRLALFWVVSAKRDDTRRKRLASLIAASRERRHVY